MGVILEYFCTDFVFSEKMGIVTLSEKFLNDKEKIVFLQKKLDQVC